MTELSIRPDEIRDALQKFVSEYQPDAASKEEVGTVAQAGDGIARVSGLPSSNSRSSLAIAEGSPLTRAMPSPASATVPTSSRLAVSGW